MLPQTFVGREEVLTLLSKRVEALKSGYRQNVALTGQKLCGKTSILQYFLATLRDSAVIPVYIEVLNESLDTFSKKFIGTMLFNYFKSQNEDVREDLYFLIGKAQWSIPKTTSAIKEVMALLEKGDYQEAYSSLFNLASVLRQESLKSCVIILDEFHNLSFFNLKNPFAIFGKRIMVQKDTMYVVTSSQVSSIKKILKEKLDLLFGNFEVIEIRDFDYSVSRRFLEKRLEGVALQGDFGDYLTAFTDGRPFYLDIIASKLLDIAAQHDTKEVNGFHIAVALEELLFDSKGTLNQYFQNLISPFTQTAYANDYVAILSAVAEGKRTLGGIRSAFTGKKNDLTARAAKLTEENFIAKNGSIYYLNDRVFEFWLKHVLNRKRHSLLSSFQDRSDSFRKEVEGLIVAFLSENKKKDHERIRELLASFSGEVVVIGEKSIKFPPIAAIEIEDPDTSPGGFSLRALYETRKFWFIRFSQSPVDESVMASYMARLEEMSPAPQRTILVAFGGIDQNAMLIAKENKIVVWGRGDINLLMSLFRKLKFLCP